MNKNTGFSPDNPNRVYEVLYNDTKKRIEKSYLDDNLHLLRMLYSMVKGEKITQAKLSKEADVSPGTIKYWETNSTIPQYENIKKLVDFYRNALDLPFNFLNPNTIISDNYAQVIFSLIRNNYGDDEENISHLVSKLSKGLQ